MVAEDNTVAVIIWPNYVIVLIMYIEWLWNGHSSTHENYVNMSRDGIKLLTESLGSVFSDA